MGKYLAMLSLSFSGVVLASGHHVETWFAWGFCQGLSAALLGLGAALFFREIEAAREGRE